MSLAIYGIVLSCNCNVVPAKEENGGGGGAGTKLSDETTNKEEEDIASVVFIVPRCSFKEIIFWSPFHLKMAKRIEFHYCQWVR